jgi:hypothetical protein
MNVVCGITLLVLVIFNGDRYPEWIQFAMLIASGLFGIGRGIENLGKTIVSIFKEDDEYEN